MTAGCSWTSDDRVTPTSSAPRHAPPPQRSPSSAPSSSSHLPPLCPYRKHGLVTSQSSVVWPWGEGLEVTVKRRAGFFPDCREKEALARLADCFIQGCFAPQKAVSSISLLD